MAQTYEMMTQGTISNNSTANVEIQTTSNNMYQLGDCLELHIEAQTYGTGVGYASMYMWFNQNWTPGFPGSSYNSGGQAYFGGSSISITGGPNTHPALGLCIGQASSYGTASQVKSHFYVRMWDVVGTTGTSDQDRYMGMTCISNCLSGWNGSSMTTPALYHHTMYQQYDYDLRGVHNIRFGFPSSYTFASGTNYQLYGIKNS